MEVLEKVFNYLLDNYALYMVVTMGVIIMVINTILMLVKKPIKKLTAKITNEKLRKLANKMFIAFAFGLSALAWFALSKAWGKYFAFEQINVLLTGAFSIVIYALGDGIINGSKAVELIETVKGFAEEEKTEGKESAVDSFWKIAKK